MEQLRTVFFLGVLTAILIVIGNLVGGFDGMIVAFFFAVLMNGFSYFFSDKIVLWMYHAQPLDEKSSEGARVHRLVRGVTQKMHLPKMPRLYTISEKSPNAFATGRGPENAAVVFTQGILQLLNDDELEGVIAHELSHIQNRDILIASVAATIAGAIGIIAHSILWMGFGGREREGKNPIGLIVIAIIIPIIAMLIQLAVSRSREFLADETAAKTLHTGHGLASALKKLEKGISHTPFTDANRGTAHMFIANPFSAGAVMGWFATHPSLYERIQRLEKIG
jgi:heat shock protein HtpX